MTADLQVSFDQLFQAIFFAGVLVGMLIIFCLHSFFDFFSRRYDERLLEDELSKVEELRKQLESDLAAKSSTGQQ